MHHILPPSTPTNPIKLAKTHTHAVNHSKSYPPYQYFSSISLTFWVYAHSTQHALIVPHAPSLPLLISHNKPHSFLSCTLCYTKLTG